MIYILLPAYNEELSLKKIMKNISECFKHNTNDYMVVVCNDGSTDETGAILESFKDVMPLDVLTHPINRGLGETSRDLFEYAVSSGKPGDVIIRMDCDNTHESQYMTKMLSKIQEGADVVIASRFQPGGGQKGVSLYRATVSRAANIFMKVFFPIKDLREYSCGFRAYKYEIIKKAVDYYGNNFIQLKGLGFTCTLEKLVKLNLLGAKFDEIPFVLRYDKKESPSKMVSSITTLGYIIMVVVHYWPWGGWRSIVRKNPA